MTSKDKVSFVDTLCVVKVSVCLRHFLFLQHTLLQFSAQKFLFKTIITRKSSHESTDQQLVTEKFVPWRSRDMSNEMIRVAQA